METPILQWLASVGSRAMTVSLWLFVLINGAALAAIFISRDRALVNRWTGRLLATNLVLAGTGLGIPVMTAVARLALSAVSPSMTLLRPTMDKSEAAPRMESVLKP